MALNTTCAVMPSGSAASGRNAAKSVVSRVARSTATIGSRSWLSAVARPWPGRCLRTGSTPPSRKPVGDRPRDRRDIVRAVAIGAIADHRVGAGDRHIGERQAVDIDAQIRQIGGDQPRTKAGGGEPGARVLGVEPSVSRARRIGRPMRRLQPLHAPAFLVDQDRSIAPDRVTQRRHERAHLIGIGDIALEENEAPRLGFGQKRALVRGELRAGDSSDKGADRHPRGLACVVAEGQARGR